MAIYNEIAGFNDDRDIIKRSTFISVELLNFNKINNIINGNGIAKKIINIPVDEALRKDIVCHDVIFEYLREINFFNQLNYALKSARTYGFALMVFFEALDKNGLLNLKSISQPASEIMFNIGCIKVFDVSNVKVFTRYANPNAKNYGDPELFEVTLTDNQKIQVHESRCIKVNSGHTYTNPSASSRFFTLKNPDIRSITGTSSVYCSALQDVFQVLKIMDITNYSINNQLIHCNKTYIKTQFDNTSAKDSLERRDRIANMIRFFNNNNTLVIDNDMSIERHQYNFAGVESILSEIKTMLSAETGIPQTKLFGIPPSGLNSSTTEDEDRHIVNIERFRNEHVKPAIEYVFKFFANPLVKQELSESITDDDLMWSFSELKVQSEEQRIKVIKDTVETYMKLFVDTGITNAEYIASKIMHSEDAPTIYWKFDEKEIAQYKPEEPEPLPIPEQLQQQPEQQPEPPPVEQKQEQKQVEDTSEEDLKLLKKLKELKQ